MKGSIEKDNTKGSKKPRWRYRIYLGRNVGGKKLWDSKAGFAKQAEASEAMRTRIEELEREKTQPASAEHQTLGQWLALWLDTYAVDRCQPKTLERYQQLAKYITGDGEEPSDLAKAPLPSLSHQQLELALFNLLKAKGRRREHISARTVGHVGGLLSVALNKAFKLELITVNPMLRVEMPTVKKSDARALAPDEIQRLREVCRGDWTFALIEVALASGARRGELLCLTWADVDWLSSSLTVSKSLEQTKAGVRVKRPKGNKTRQFRLPQTAIIALRFLKDQQQVSRTMFGTDYRPYDLIFCEPDGDYLQPDLVSAIIIRRLKKAKITDASLHSLRHSHASNLISRGVPLPAVAARLGHADPAITARVYSHAIPADDQRAADEWDTMLEKKSVQ
jgi:integrase